MISKARRGGISPVGEAVTVAANPWFKVLRQPVDIHDPATGRLKRSAADGAQMNYLEISSPGVLIVADLGGAATLLAAQERYTTNLVEGKQVRHYELPGGAIDSNDHSENEIIAAAEKEFGEEMGYQADDYTVLGSRKRGLMTHPYVTDHNFTVLARNARPIAGRLAHEDNEVIGAPERFSWDETHEMSDSSCGLYAPDYREFKVISSAPTVASLALAERYINSDPR